MSLKILDVGLTLIEDSGRIGFEHVGVPTSGAWDAVSYQLANALVRDEGLPVFEIIAGNFSLLAKDELLIAVVGSAKVLVDQKPSSADCSFLLKPGMVLTVEPLRAGPVYLAVKGLIASKTLGSASTDTLSGLGEKQVRSGDEFQIIKQLNSDLLAGAFLQGKPVVSKTIQFVAGPHDAEIAGKHQVESVSRSGIRLSTTSQSGSAMLPSFPVMPGAIQLTPSGESVILGPDSGTTGGYPVVGMIIEAHQHFLAHLKTGDQVQLQQTNIEQAAIERGKLAKSLRQTVIRPNAIGSW